LQEVPSFAWRTNVQEFPQRPNHIHIGKVAETPCCTKPLRGGLSNTGYPYVI
jgi:hypothetical protein